MVFDRFAEGALGFPLVGIGGSRDAGAMETVVDDLMRLLEADIGQSSRCGCAEGFCGGFHGLVRSASVRFGV